MIKTLLIAFLGMLAFQNVSARYIPQTDTLLYCMKNDGRLVANKDSADYFIFNLPADPNTGLYKVVEIYHDGKPKLITNTKTRSYIVIKEGVTTAFFKNGRHKSIVSYENGACKGEAQEFYPNGMLYNIKNYNIADSILLDGKKLSAGYAASLVECRDTSGNVLTRDGTGSWIDFDTEFKKIIAQGPVTEGRENGEWNGPIDDTGRFVCNYKAGKIVSGTGYDKAGKAYPLKEVTAQPFYKGGMQAFYAFLQRNIRYPAVDREKNITGKVLVTFIVERDGTLTNVHTLSQPSESLGDESVRVIKLSSPWMPGFMYGMVSRMQYTVPVNFSLSSEGLSGRVN